jgi:hypothetical protein
MAKKIEQSEEIKNSELEPVEGAAIESEEIATEEETLVEEEIEEEEEEEEEDDDLSHLEELNANKC